MFSMNFHIFLLFSTYHAAADFIEKTTENYGPYTLEMVEFYSCRGPKVANLTSYTSTLETDSNSVKGVVNMTFLEQATIEVVKMTVHTIKEDRKIPLWNYMVTKPCQHYAMSKVFEMYVKAQNCVVKKGTYLSILNLSELVKSYLGTSFFYGEFLFKSTVVSKKGNIICLVFHPNFKKDV